MGDEPVPPFDNYGEFFLALFVATAACLFLVWLLAWHPGETTSRDHCPPGQVLVTTPDGVGRCSR